jgi:L-alanine-DL-glutamate epimerase-like enolase superfamily enzyme
VARIVSRHIDKAKYRVKVRLVYDDGIIGVGEKSVGWFARGEVVEQDADVAARRAVRDAVSQRKILRRM